MFQPNNVLKRMIAFNKSAYENTFKNVQTLQEPMENLLNLYINQAAGFPEDGKKAAREWVSMYKKGFEDFKIFTDENFRRAELFFQEKEPG